jgi:hypothetical protein
MGCAPVFRPLAGSLGAFTSFGFAFASVNLKAGFYAYRNRWICDSGQFGPAVKCQEFCKAQTGDAWVEVGEF